MHERKTVLLAKDLHKRFMMGNSEVRALAGVDISLTSGELVMLLGPSGSGKTTLLHVLSGLEAPDTGSVIVEGKDIYSLSDSQLSRLRSEKFGFVFQSFNLLAPLTALENVEIPLRVAGKPQAKKRALDMLARVGLAERAHHKPGQMSGGEQQRVSIARALVAEPSIVFADEPTGNLDSDTGAEIMGLLSALVADNNAACIMVTHNTELVELADRVLHLRNGRIVETISKA
ncbi:MAG: ABC transporter ATP-binding protein [Bacillota bacterium]|jgi:ABC-type lipoprotein export system ATPase subunit|nr:ABC transporter ATP-binding protein [Candidatus Fermentithermobacillaceae bacterium]